MQNNIVAKVLKLFFIVPDPETDSLLQERVLIFFVDPDCFHLWHELNYFVRLLFVRFLECHAMINNVRKREKDDFYCSKHGKWLASWVAKDVQRLRTSNDASRYDSIICMRPLADRRRTEKRVL